MFGSNSRQENWGGGSYLFSASLQHVLMAPIMVDGDGKKLQIKLTSQMRNYAKWDLLESNKLRCVFF